MKKSFIPLVLCSMAILGIAGCRSTQSHHKCHEKPEFKAGETVSLIDGIKLYAEFVTSTNLQNVIIYGYDDEDQLNLTAKAESADYIISDEDGIRLTLHNVIIETKDENGQPITIEAKLYPLVLDENFANQRVDPTRKTPADSAKD